MKYIFIALSILSFMGPSLATTASIVPKSDAEVVNMLMTANTEEMNLAKAGMKKADNQKVEQFAERMFQEHKKSNDRAASLRKEENIKLVETQRSQELKTKVENSIEKMKNLKGKEFDKAFMDAQVTLHQKTLHKLETTLIPNTKNQALKRMLNEDKEHVVTHLREAQEIKSSL